LFKKYTRLDFQEHGKAHCIKVDLVKRVTADTLLTRLRSKGQRHPDHTRTMIKGDGHDQADAKWILVGGLLRGHNDTPCGRPTPGRPIRRPGVGRLYGVFGVFS
jgi:hypothetical protein